MSITLEVIFEDKEIDKDKKEIDKKDIGTVQILSEGSFARNLYRYIVNVPSLHLYIYS